MSRNTNGLRRSTGLMVFEVGGAMPNGSPDMNNMPRLFNDGRCWMSPVSIKRKIRDVLADHDSMTFQEIIKITGMAADSLHILESRLRGMNSDNPVDAKNQALELARNNPTAFLSKYWDVRVFGTTLLEEKDKGQEAVDEEDDEAPTDAPLPKASKSNAKSSKAKPSGKVTEEKPDEKKRVRFLRTGPVTFQPAESIAPVEAIEATIAKRFPFREKLLLQEQGDLAPMAYKFVKHGLFTMRFGVNPHVAHHTNTTAEDIEVLKKVMPYMFQLTASAARPAGSITPVHLWWADHENSIGSFNEYEFYRQLTPHKKAEAESPSERMAEYEIPAKVTLKGVTAIDLLSPR